MPRITSRVFVLLFFLGIILFSMEVSPVKADSLDDFVITVQTDIPGVSSDTQFTIPTYQTETYNYNVDCNDDGIDEATGVTGDYTCDYGSPGTYQVRIKDNTGTGSGFPVIYFYDVYEPKDNDKLLTIEQWGSGHWSSMYMAFYYCTNLSGQPSDTPDLSNLTDLSYMFFGAENFNADISGWDTSSVTNMKSMFGWAHSFNQDIGGWDTSSVTSMLGMFNSAYAFNSDISGWDTGSLTDVNFMFMNANSFNQPIGSWDMSNVNEMRYMFYSADVFNGDISGWDTSSVTDMSNMFTSCGSFAQDLSAWDVSALTDATDMFGGMSLPTVLYDALLIGWDSHVLQPNVSFSAGTSTYCHAESARANMASSDGWLFSDSGMDCSHDGDFVITVRTDKPGTSVANQFTIPTTGTGYDYNVDCNSDGTDEASAISGDYTCSYNSVGTYTISIQDNTGAGTGFPRIYFNSTGDKDKLIKIQQWGTGLWSSMELAFSGCSELSGSPLDVPDLSNTDDLRWMFYKTDSFNGDISGWDTSTITDMMGMFLHASNFNQDIGGWDTSNVSNMAGMFGWAGQFNQDISGWDTGNVTTMQNMFLAANSFNQPIGAWVTSAVTDMSGMFKGVNNFDQDLSGWDLTVLEDASEMFSGAALSTTNYDALLIGWDAQDLLPGVIFDAGDSTYCDGESAKAHMVSLEGHGWQIADGGKNCHFPYSVYLPLVVSRLLTDPSADFVISVNTENPGSSSSTQFTIPTYLGESYNYNVDCDNDGVDEVTGADGDTTCNYAAPGIYTVRIKDNSGNLTGFPRIDFYGGGDHDKLLTIEQWGKGQWTSMERAFAGCSNLAGQASDVPDLSNVTDLHGMFNSASNFNQDIGDWDTSNITDMSTMFYHAGDFNQDISGWDTGNVTTMAGMFIAAESFNQPIGAWDTRSLTDITSMFFLASSLNQDLSGWDTSNVTSMIETFRSATVFNGDIHNWVTSTVTDMSGMFKGALNFDQDLGGWNVTSLEDASDMFAGAALSTANYDALLIGWDAQSLQPGVVFDAGDSTYCSGESARENMITLDGWVITDGGKACVEP